MGPICSCVFNRLMMFIFWSKHVDKSAVSGGVARVCVFMSQERNISK